MLKFRFDRRISLIIACLLKRYNDYLEEVGLFNIDIASENHDVKTLADRKL